MKFWKKILLFFLATIVVFRLESGDLKTKTFILKSVDPKVVQIQVQSSLSKDGRIDIDGTKKEITITDYAENLQKAEEIINNIDKSSNINKNEIAEKEQQPYTDIIEIHYMSATQVYNVLKDVFGTQLGGGNYYTSGSQNKENIFKNTVKVQVLPDDQRLMIFAVADDNRKIREVVSKIDNAKVGENKKNQRGNNGVFIKNVTLHHIPSSEAMDALNKLLENDGGGYSRNGKNSGSRAFINAKVDAIEIKESNSILLVGTSEDFNGVLDLINQMDAQPAQVLIEVTILEITLSNGKSLGFEWALKKNDITMQNKYSLAEQMASGTTKGFFVQYQNDYMNAVFNAIENGSDVKVLSSPHLLVENNKRAAISIGDSVVINKESIEIPTANASNPIVKTTHEYVDVGLKLQIYPKINEDGAITLEIIQDVNDIKDSGVAGFPQISKRNLTTTITANNKDLIVLGGLLSRKVTNVDTKIPIIGYLPVIGRAFRKSDKNVQTTELVLLMTPTIVRNSTDSDNASREQKERIQKFRKKFFKE